MSDITTPISDAEFETEVLQSDLPVVVDFWATWCAPCKALSPVLEKVAENYKGRVRVVKVDIDQNQQSPMEYGVRGVPTLIAFNGGQAQATHVGLASEEEIERLFEEVL